jgi:hypothetical protein
MKLKKSFTLFLIVSLTASVFAFFSFFVVPVHAVVASPPNWLSGFTYCRSFNVTNSSQSAGQGYQIPIVINETGSSGINLNVPAGHHNSDWSDLRFTNTTGNQLENYWIQQSNSTYCKVWLQVSGTLTATNQTEYLYYGNTTAVSSLSNGYGTFQFFDNFAGSTLNATNWSTISPASVTVNNGWVTVNATSNAWQGIVGKYNMTYGRWDCNGSLNGMGSGFYEEWGLGTGVNLNSGNYGVFYWDTTENANTYSQVGTSSTKNSIARDTATHIYEILWSSGKMVFNINGATVKTHTTNIPSGGINATVGCYASKSNSTMYWVFQSKYVSPEPAFVAWGTENTYGRDTTPPTYSGVASNATIRNTAVNCSVLWNDDTNVSGAIFGCNFTGSWVNQTWTSSSTVWINSTAARYDYTTTLSTNVGDADQWEQWCNDTSNNWNNTGIQTITTTLDAWTARATFIITVSGSNYQAWYGANSTLAFQSTNASQVGNFAFGNLTSGIQQTVVFIGNFTLTSPWLIPSYCTADFTQANITASASITRPFLVGNTAINGGSNTNINIIGGQFYTNPSTSTTYIEAIIVMATFNFNVTKTWINCYGEASTYGQGIDISNSQFGTIAYNTVFYSGDDEIDITNCTSINILGNHLQYGLDAGVDVEGGASNIVISENQIYDMSLTTTQGGIEIHWHTGQTPCQGITVSNNNIFDCCYGVGVDYTSGPAGNNTNIIISNNLINESAQNGINVNYANGVIIDSNNISNS